MGEEKNSKINPIMDKIFKQSKKHEKDGPFEKLKYQNIELIFKLKALTNNGAGKNIDQLVEKIQNIDELSELIDLQSEITNMIENIIGQFQTELDHAKEFLSSIDKTLEAMINDIEVSSQTMDRYISNDLVFTENVKIDLHLISSASDKIGDLDELKSMINKKINDIINNFTEQHSEVSQTQKTIYEQHEKITKEFKDILHKINNKIKTIEEQNQIDPLTGINNRRVFQDRISQELERFHRYKQSFSMIFFDIDNFKQINDKYGHKAGDIVLRVIAQRTQKIMRESDILSRFGGDEFTIILPATNLENAMIVTKKIIKVIQETEFDYEKERVFITFSVGVTEVRELDNHISLILNRVDSYMYEAKNRGRNCIISDKDMSLT